MGVMGPGPWVHCGRVFSVEEIAGIRQTVAWLRRLGRRELAATLCEHLQWYTATGTAKAHACREFLERLEAAGLLVLPPLQVARRPCPAPPRRRFKRPWQCSARWAWSRCVKTRRWRSGLRPARVGTPWATRVPSATGCAAFARLAVRAGADAAGGQPGDDPSDRGVIDRLAATAVRRERLAEKRRERHALGAD